MANNQITPFQLTDQFTMDNFNQRINETNTALQNKAPAGYGLGESHGRDLSNVSLNSLINNGWYFLYRNNTDGPDNVNISDAILFVSSARSDLTKVQRLTLGTQGMQGYELRRVYNNSSW